MKTPKLVPCLTAIALTALVIGCKQETQAAAENTAQETIAAAATATAPPATDAPKTVLLAQATTIRYAAQPGGSKAIVAGDSSIHKWTMESGVIGGTIDADPNFPESALTDTAAARPATTVYVPVRSIKSGKATMDERMLETMSATTYARIEYKLIELKPKSKPGTTGALEFDAVGTLTIVGKTITNTMPVTIEKKDGKLKIVGSTPLKLTQFEIKPPVIALPLLPDISVYDDLKVDFEWTLAPRPEKKS